MDNNLFQRLKDLVTQHQAIGIVVPPNPTHDEMAAGLGMYLALKQMGKAVSIACPTDPTVAISSLVGIDKVQRALSGSGGDLVVTFPYREGEIEKVSYTVDNGQLNIVVKAGQNGLSFNQSDVQFRQGGAMPTLLFTMGVIDMSQVSNVVNPAEMTNVTVVNLDNKQNNTGFGDVVHVSPRFSSISEMVADFLTLLEPQIELDVDTSQDLLSGILSANNDFQNGQGSYLAFEMTGILMKKGAVRNVNGNAGANPTATAMPTNNYFPPQQQAVQASEPISQQPVQQQSQSVQSFEPAGQPIPSMQQFPAPDQLGVPLPNQPIQNFQQPVMQQEPVQQVQPVQQPVQPVQNVQPVQQQNGQPPSDWLTPKVYKGSTVL
ncbi:MAG TPA: hypothetical protein VF189_01960 [Patescibacteria group bacterium]